MQKKFRYMNFLFIICSLLGCQNNNFAVDKKSSCNEPVISDEYSLWSDQEKKAVEREVAKFIDAIKIKDMNTISDQISYPMQLIGQNEHSIQFNNKKQFLSFKFDELFDEQFVNTIINSDSNKLFSSWRGFMLGEGAGTVWFSPDEKGNVLIYGIVVEHFPKSSFEIMK